MKMINLLQEVLAAYDAFFREGSFMCRIDNPAWVRLTDAMHQIRIYLNKRKKLSYKDLK